MRVSVGRHSQRNRLVTCLPIHCERIKADTDNPMRKAFGFKLQSQKNVIKIGNMIDDMWGIHLHIMLLTRRYRRMFGKDVSAFRIKKHIAKLKKRTKPQWADLPSQVVQDVVLRYGKSQDAFFQNKKDRKKGLTTRKVGRPKIKPRHKYNSMRRGFCLGISSDIRKGNPSISKPT